MKFPSIKEVAVMSDEELMEFLDFPGKLKAFKEEVEELNELKGAAREEADRMWGERMAPRLEADSLRWMKDDAIRSARTPEEVLKDKSVEIY